MLINQYRKPLLRQPVQPQQPLPQLQPPQPNVQDFIMNTTRQYLLGQYNNPGPAANMRRRYGMVGQDFGFGLNSVRPRPGIFY